MIGIPAALLYANASEWFIHKYILHGWGKNKQSFWNFHWHEHHKHSRKNEHMDEDYERSLLEWNAQTKEALGVFGLAALHAPLFPVAPFFTSTVFYCAYNYYTKHKRSHMEPDWAKENLSWHYDHHMGPNQDANWCVTKPWFDEWMGTREVYVGTEREAQDIQKKKVLKERRIQKKEEELGEEIAISGSSLD